MRDAGNEVREIRATGGFARSALWRQMLADTLGMPVGFPADHEGSAFGAALLAMEARGLVEGIGRAADLLDIEDVVEPEAGAAAVYADLRPTFVVALRGARVRLSHAGAPPLRDALGGPGASCP